jgi:flagellar biosynthesis protein
MKPRERQKAVALRYEQGRDRAPTLVAKGRGKMAERIVALAEAYDVPLVEDRSLVETLENLDLDTEIPEALYRAVAEVLVFVYRMDRSLNR